MEMAAGQLLEISHSAIRATTQAETETLRLPKLICALLLLPSLLNVELTHTVIAVSNLTACIHTAQVESFRRSTCYAVGRAAPLDCFYLYLPVKLLRSSCRGESAVIRLVPIRAEIYVLVPP